MVVIKQVVALKLKNSYSLDKCIDKINEILREYQDRKGELVSFLPKIGSYNAIIQYDA